jgi:hypothetical protein
MTSRRNPALERQLKLRKRKDKQLAASLVVVLAALGAAVGVEVDETQLQSGLEILFTSIAGLAAVFALFRGMYINAVKKAGGTE